MTSFVTGMVLLAAVLHATWNAVVKSGTDRLLTQTVVIGVASLVGLCALPFLPFPVAASWPWLLASVMIHLVYFLALTASYEHGDFSQVYPIARGSAPLLVAAAAPFLFGETLSVAGSLGVAVISLGILSLAWQPDLFRRRPEKPILFALITAVTIMGYSLVDARGVRIAAAADGDTGAFGYIAWLFFLCGPVLAAVVLPRRRGRLRGFMGDDRGRSIGGGIVACAAYSLVLWAFSLGAVASVTALRETSVVIAAGIGAVLFREAFGFRRILAAVAVALGVALLNAGGAP